MPPEYKSKALAVLQPSWETVIQRNRGLPGGGVGVQPPPAASPKFNKMSILNEKI
jgi:hypothetical protein